MWKSAVKSTALDQLHRGIEARSDLEWVSSLQAAWQQSESFLEHKDGKRSKKLLFWHVVIVMYQLPKYKDCFHGQEVLD